MEDEVIPVTENESIYIPPGYGHRIANPGLVPMVIIEVQTGSCIGDDVYARGQGAKGKG